MSNPTDSNSTICIPSTQPNLPQLPTEIPIDPTHPIVWILALTTFLGTAAKTLNASVQLTRTIAILVRSIGKRTKGQK